MALDLFDYGRNKLCNLYDSTVQAKGQAHSIVFTNNLTGEKSLTFNLPFTVDKEANFRWGFIKNEHLLRLTIGDYKDWFIVRSPNKTKNNKSISNAVTCSHLSDVLKTKSLWLIIDDTNGIGTMQYLVELVLNKSGWKLGYYDTMYETDGQTEKVRSIKSDGKDGAKK